MQTPSYKLLQTDFVTQEYFESVNCASQFTSLAWLVTSSHRFKVEIGKYDERVAT